VHGRARDPIQRNRCRRIEQMIDADVGSAAMSIEGFIAKVITSPNFIIIIFKSAAECADGKIGVLAEKIFETKLAIQIGRRDDQAQHLIGGRKIRSIPVKEEVVSLGTVVVE